MSAAALRRDPDPDEEPAGNGKVTLALVQRDIKYLRGDIEDLKTAVVDRIGKLEEIVTEQRVTCSAQITRVENHSDAIKELRRHSNTWDRLNSIFAAVAAVVGYMR